MIRDPSDGTVRETKPDLGGARSGLAPDESGMETALPPIDTKEFERLERSREWLKTYSNRVLTRITEGE